MVKISKSVSDIEEFSTVEMLSGGITQTGIPASGKREDTAADSLTKSSDPPKA